MGFTGVCTGCTMASSTIVTHMDRCSHDRYHQAVIGHVTTRNPMKHGSRDAVSKKYGHRTINISNGKDDF